MAVAAGFQVSRLEMPLAENTDEQYFLNFLICNGPVDGHSNRYGCFKNVN